MSEVPLYTLMHRFSAQVSFEGVAGWSNATSLFEYYPPPKVRHHPTPYTLHPTSYTLHPASCTLHPKPYTLQQVRGVAPNIGLRAGGASITVLRRNVKRFRGGLVFKAHRLSGGCRPTITVHPVDVDLFR